MQTSALVILSGGQDSTTCLFWARERFTDIHAVSFDYGQRHRRELHAARKVAGLAGVVSHHVLAVPAVLESASPLVDFAHELERYADFAAMDETIGTRVELTFVPMRNAFFLTIAANLAFARGIETLVTGVCEADNANYPDCRESFLAAQERTINEALGVTYFRILAPLLHATKAQSIELAQSLPGCMEALAYSHTCYAGDFPPCGTCHACVLRAHGFAEAGVVDPLVARAHHDHL
ncbi:7-cyano-7-deazaguanine synthase QueC [Cupriavidus taiwanensis]|uniref:7-cyano-7-deazaguanine synthase QueC n=1 Tax=Cupriavidus taiwanensis TaxID=164546 RepID=UPI000E1191D6|nr:7-cyano-7-deazaguanine synthase QueC [Cupriavidus taiwanensis]SPA17233.1 7-cyano-7-deazaguanine synthase [Cupriavidus taiwanensis]